MILDVFVAFYEVSNVALFEVGVVNDKSSGFKDRTIKSGVVKVEAKSKLEAESKLLNWLAAQYAGYIVINLFVVDFNKIGYV